MSDKFGKRIEDYENIYFLEKIHYYEIYGGYSRIAKKEVSLKILKKELFTDKDLLLKKVKNEEIILKDCKSENILDFYRYFETENSIIFEQEFYHSNLREYLMENGPLNYNLGFFKEVVLGVSKALKTLYEKGVIHRNIRTSSLFLIENNGENKIKLGQFGTAIYIKDNVSEPLNSIFYTAPEIINGEEYDEKCDLWSFGISLYELYFGRLPFGFKPSRFLVIKALNDENSFHFEKTNIPSIDYLFERLLKIDPKERMTHQELFEFVFNKIFMNDNNETIITKNETLLKSKISYNSNSDEVSFRSSINSNEDKQMYNNIIYYDENLNRNFKKDCDLFEKETLGGFIQCTNMNELEQIKKEILNEKNNYNNLKFNLIITGSAFEKITNYIRNDKAFEKCFEYYCIYCINLKKYKNLKDKYKNLKDMYNNKDDIIRFIKNTSSSKRRPFKIHKLFKYKKCREGLLKMMRFFGNINDYNRYYEEMKKYILKKDKENKLEKDKNDLLKAFKHFEKKNNKLIINKFINVLYNDFYNFIDDTYVYSQDFIDYFKARISYSFNQFDGLSYYQWNDKPLYMGKKLYFSELLNYKRTKGMIGFTNFSKFYKNKNSAIQKISSIYSNDDNLKFSVIFILTNKLKKEDLQGIIIPKNESDKEETILYLPFSYFNLQEIKYDPLEMTAEIILEIIYQNYSKNYLINKLHF